MELHRTGRDLPGTHNVALDALHGIYTERAIENFPLARRPVSPENVLRLGSPASQEGP